LSARGETKAVGRGARGRVRGVFPNKGSRDIMYGTIRGRGVGQGGCNVSLVIGGD